MTVPYEPDTTNGYDAFLNRAAFIKVEPSGYLRIEGPDQLAFIQRQTTNDIRPLAPGRIVVTVLTSPTARILDIFYLMLEPSGAMAAIPISGNGPKIARYLKSRIFIMDKVSVSDLSGNFTQLILGGPAAGEALDSLGIDALPGQGQVVEKELDGGSLRVVAPQSGLDIGYRLVATAALADELEARLLEAGAAWLSPQSYDSLRVENGLPASGQELTEDFTPLEMGLEEVISEAKGCYTGQEIIARQITYDKVTRRLSGLRLQGCVPGGAPVTIKGRPVGVITSCVQSPRYGTIALAVLKRPYNEPGTAIFAGKEDEQVNGVVIALPFKAV